VILTENKIQLILFDFFRKKHKQVIPNIFLYDWESDLIGVTKSDYVNEYEIKTSVSDFKSDFKKDKHSFFKNKTGKKIPNHFWYAVPEGLIDIKDIPSYAGLIHIRKKNKTRYTAQIIKKAPKLISTKINEIQQNHINTSLYYRFWELRKKLFKIS